MRNVFKSIILVFIVMIFSGCTTESEKKDIYIDLWWAVNEGDFERIQEAINNGADVNALEHQDKKNSIIFEVISNTPKDKDPSEVLAYLISKGSNVNLTNTKGETSLMYCFSDFHSSKYTLKMLSILLNAGANVNIQNKYGNTVLIYASSYSEGNERNEILKALIDSGADVNIKNNEGRTALSYITMGFHDIEAIRMLLKAGADVNIKDVEGKTPLMNAYDDKETANLLREYGAKEPDNEKFMFFVELKKEQSDYNKIEKYLEKFSVDEKDMYNGYIPLKIAVSNSNIKLLKFLIEKGADVNMKSGISDNYTPLMSLMYQFRYDRETETKMDILKTILNNKKLKINEIGECCEQDTVLDIALRVKNEIVGENRSSEHIENVIKGLRAYGAKTYDELMKDIILNFDPKTIRKYSPKVQLESQKILRTDNPDIIKLQKDFIDAIDKDDLEKIERLYADLKTVNFDIDNTTPLNYAILEKRTLIFKWLMKHNANVNYCPEKGVYPLDAAIDMVDREMISILLDAGADPNLTQKHNVVSDSLEPPLMASLRVDIMLNLLKYGADINYIDENEKETVLDHAIGYNDGVIELLRKCGAKTYSELILGKITSGELKVSNEDRDEFAKIFMTRSDHFANEFIVDYKMALYELQLALSITNNEELQIEIKNKIAEIKILIDKNQSENSSSEAQSIK